MLGPEYLASLPEPAVKLWQQAEDDILRDIARRFQKAGAITTTAAWQAWRLEQTRAVYTDTEKKLAEYTGQSREVIRRLLIEAGTEALMADDAIHRQAGKEPPPANRSGQLLNLLNAGYRQTLGTWLNLTATTANTVSGEFEHALSRAWLQVSSGAFDYNTAIRRAVDDLADRMGYVTYPSGHKDTLETAVRRAVLTGVNQTAGKLQMARAEEMGCEFVEVTAHEGARPDHALWQGRIYHIGGEIDYEGNHYEDFVKATGYGTGPGLCGWNCRHNFYPFYPGISLRAYTDERLAELNAPSVEYRGKKYTRYEISQMQRAKERTVRKYKRRFLAESEAGLDTGTSAVRLKAARQDLKQFIQETGSKEDSARVSVHGFGRSAAGKANWAAKKQQIDFMGQPHVVTIGNGKHIKAYEVKGHERFLTQSYSQDAQQTIALIEKQSKQIPQLNSVKEIVISKSLRGIAAYDHEQNRLYVNEALSNKEYIQRELSDGYFVAENAEDVLRHEMHHKDHWDKIKSISLTSGKSSDIVKAELEAPIQEYVSRQRSSDLGYIRKFVSKNAENNFRAKHSLNELIADIFLQDDKGSVRDSTMLAIVRRCIG